MTVFTVEYLTRLWVCDQNPMWRHQGVVVGRLKFAIRPLALIDLAAILLAAGGRIVTLDNRPLQYNCKPSLLNPEFLVFGDPARDWQVVERRGHGIR